jgi:hypothetical protein
MVSTRQECTGVGPNVPATETRLDPTTATCTNSVADVRIGHALLLAPFCDITGLFFADSLFIECAFGNEFYVPKVDESYRYSCAETVVFDSGVTATKDVSTVVIRTDQSWQDDFFTDCVRFTKPGDNTTNNSAPLSAPRGTGTIMPVVSENRGAMPPAIVNNGPTPPSASTSRGDNSNIDEAASKAPIGTIVGVTVGAVLFLAIAGAVLFVMLCWKPQQQRKESQVKEVTEHVTGYSGQVDHRLAGEEGGWTGHDPAFPPAAPTVYAAVEVMPMEVTDDHASSDRVTAKSNDRVTAKSTGSNDFPNGERSGDRGASDGNYRHSNPDQQEVAVTFKDQVQSMVVDGHPMASNPFHLSPRTATAATATQSVSRRYAYQQQDNNVVAPVTFNDNTQNMIRPDAIGVPTNAMLDHHQEDYHSGLTDGGDTRGSSDPSGIYSHEMSMLDSN